MQMISINLKYEDWERICFFLENDAREGSISGASSKLLLQRIRAQIPPGPVTMDPVAAAERALEWIPQEPVPMDPRDVKEAIKELAHGLAACERRRIADHEPRRRVH